MKKSKKKVLFKLGLGVANAHVLARTFGNAARIAAREIRCEQQSRGVPRNKLYQLRSDRSSGGFKDVAGGPENEFVGRLGPAHTVADLLFRHGVLTYRSKLRSPLKGAA